ncbi:MAG: LysE family translocator [Bdellovibrionota bacterium]
MATFSILRKSELGSLMNVLMVCMVYLLAAATPGPSQFFILEQVLLKSPRAARWAALGVSLGTLIWVLFVIWGLGSVVASHPESRVVIAYLSVALLLYFAARNLRLILQRRNTSLENAQADAHQEALSSHRSSFTQGVLVNLLNPNSVVFFMTLFAPLVAGKISGTELFLSVTGVMILSVAWYQLIAAAWRFKSFYVLLKSQTALLRLLLTLFYVYWAIKLVINFKLLS